MTVPMRAHCMIPSSTVTYDHGIHRPTAAASHPAREDSFPRLDEDHHASTSRCWPFPTPPSYSATAMEVDANG
jgi:hypothetical protein